MCIGKKAEERQAIINRGWMELVFLGIPMVPYLATCTTRVSRVCMEERMRWISGIAIKREDIDFHLNTSVPLSPLPLRLSQDVPPVDQTTNFTRPLMSGCAAD